MALPRIARRAAAPLLALAVIGAVVGGPAGAAITAAAAFAWLLTRPPRPAAWIGAAGCLVAAVLLVLPAPSGQALSPEALRRQASEGYRELWLELDALAASAARAVTVPHDPSRQLAAFESLQGLLPEPTAGKATLLLIDPSGVAAAWAGAGLLQEPELSELPRQGRAHVAGYSAVTLLSLHAIPGTSREWSIAAGRSLSADRLPFDSPGGRFRDLRWTVAGPGTRSGPGVLEIPLAGAPSMLLETRPRFAPETPAPEPPADRAARLALALALLALAALTLRRGGGAVEWASAVPALGAVLLVARAIGADPRALALLVAGLGGAALVGRWVVSAAAAPARRPLLWGAASALVALGAALGIQLAHEPVDLAGPIFGPATVWALRAGFAGLVAALLLPAAGGAAEPRRATGRWAWLALAALLAAAAIVDRTAGAATLVVVGAVLAAHWARRAAAARSAVGLAVVGLLAALVAADAWEVGHRSALRRYLARSVLPRLEAPTALELDRVRSAMRAHLESVDLDRLSLQPLEAMDRQDLAYELWHHSPLATRGALSALAVFPAAGAPSRFAFGLQLTGEGVRDLSPLGRPEPQLPGWDESEFSDTIELRRSGESWGVARYWLAPRPGFGVGALPLADLAAGMLRGGPLPSAPAEELVAPASFALYRRDGVPLFTTWGDGPRLAPALLERGRGRSPSPAGPATVLAQHGPEAVRVLFLPYLGAAAGLERVGAQVVSVLMLCALLSLVGLSLAGALRLRERALRVLRSYSQRLLVVFGTLVLVPVVLLNLSFLRFMTERLEKEQEERGVATLDSAQRFLSDYIVGLRPGFSVETQLDNELLIRVAGMLRQDVNLYWGSQVTASSKQELFTAGFLPKRIPGEVYARLVLRSQRRSSRVNRVGGSAYLELYAPLRVLGVRDDRPRLFVSAPLLAQEEEVEDQIASLRRRVAVLTTGLLLLLAAVGTRLSRGFTEPLAELVEGTQRIADGASSLGLHPAELELATLAEAIDRMAVRIDEGRRRLVREKQVVESMVDQINSAVVSLDLAGHVLLRNSVASELLGARPGTELAASLAANPELAPVSRFLAEVADRPLQRTVKLAADSGEEEREWSLIWQPLPGEGEPSALLVVEDVTEVVRAERLEAWAEMARIIAHEIKNPLTPIRLSAEHMRQIWQHDADKFGPVFERCTLNILRQVDELQMIASEFSTYSRIPRIERREDDLVAEIAVLLEGYRAAPPRRLEFDFEARPAALRLSFDRRLVRRAVRNLIENALRVSPEGGTVRVTIEGRDDEARVEVADVGPGVPAELLSKIFEPYFSTHDTGTGLGLPIARRIAEAHGGSIRARNRRGGGLAVEIRLPVGRTVAPAEGVSGGAIASRPA